ncbi:MAG: hypothetical protein IT245_05680, partial [Bacteroidia bacterium]|nr:hypothetical protein [Bacteroidia bacterium]
IELDSERIEHLIQLLKSEKGYKFSQLYFSLGGYDQATYKSLYQVDRFDKVRSNIQLLMSRLKKEQLPLGIHFHIKLDKGTAPDIEKAMAVYNKEAYPFVYISHSVAFFSNDGYQRNALINYIPNESESKLKACAYLNKTRFAADGAIWADGCVISEMPGDSSLKLGDIQDSFETIEKNRFKLINDWELKGEIPKPCRGCTMYRERLS